MQALDLYSLPEPGQEGVLGRYRRRVALPLAEAWVAAWSQPGDLVVDPFCQSTTVLRAAATAGRRAVGATRNPLLALLLRVEATPPALGALEAALQRLHDAPKADAPLGLHLDGLYATACSRCGAGVAAEALIWDRLASLPVAREYACPHCGHRGREPVPSEEVPRHLTAGAQPFHRRLVAERLRVEGAPPRLVERLLDLYTPRSLYALTALLLKLEVLYSSAPLLDPLRVALLHTLDLASKLHAADEAGWHPVGSLVPPRRFREANVWRTFVAAVRALAEGHSQPALPLAAMLGAGEQPAPGTAHLSADPLPRLGAAWPGRVVLMLSELPRFDPTFAALSYLWSGWLLGKEGSRAALHLLHQRAPGDLRYLRALQAALAALAPALAPQGRLGLVFQAPGTRYLENLLVAAGAAGLVPVHAWHGLLDSRPSLPLAAGRAEHHLAFARQPASAPTGDAAAVRSWAVRTAIGIVTGRAEPTPFGALHGPIWSGLAMQGLLASRNATQAEALRGSVEQAVAQALESCGALRAEAVPGDEHGAALWVAEVAGEQPLGDRVEALVRQALAAGPLDVAALQCWVLARLPEGQVPAWPLLWACLESYGSPLDGGRWGLAATERELEAWQARMLQALEALGRRLGYAPAAAGCELAWAGGPPLTFRVQAGAEVGPLLGQGPPGPGRRVLVIPERRVALWRHKLAVVPLWRAALARAGWAFLRDEALLALLEGPAERAQLEAALGLEEGGGQLALFGP